MSYFPLKYSEVKVCKSKVHQIVLDEIVDKMYFVTFHHCCVVCTRATFS